MVNIQSDQELRSALNALDLNRQRILGGRFTQNVARLSASERVTRAIETALRDSVTPDELEDAYRAAKAHATKTYAACGKDTDWLAQADHFVAAAVTALLTPEALLTDRQSRAWKAAVQARMAINCEMMEVEEGVRDETEAQRQYAIANAFLGQG